jgi:hypothetical protein
MLSFCSSVEKDFFHASPAPLPSCTDGVARLLITTSLAISLRSSAKSHKFHMAGNRLIESMYFLLYIVTKASEIQTRSSEGAKIESKTNS